MSLCVQLATRGNLKRLERKYEGFVYCFGFGIYFVPVWWLNVKNIKLLGICFDVWDKSINFATETYK